MRRRKTLEGNQSTITRTMSSDQLNPQEVHYIFEIFLLLPLQSSILFSFLFTILVLIFSKCLLFGLPFSI
jgi:hypothetical protein